MIQDRFLYLLINLFFSIFLKEERDRELMTSLSSETFIFGKKKTENFLMFARQQGRRQAWEFLHCKSGIDLGETSIKPQRLLKYIFARIHKLTQLKRMDMDTQKRSFPVNTALLVVVSFQSGKYLNNTNINNTYKIKVE